MVTETREIVSRPFPFVFIPRSRTPSTEVQIAYVGSRPDLWRSELTVVVPEHFYPGTRGGTEPAPERRAGPKASGPVRQVRTHGPDCSIPQYAVTGNHTGICLDTIGEGTSVMAYRQPPPHPY